MQYLFKLQYSINDNPNVQYFHMYIVYILLLHKLYISYILYRLALTIYTSAGIYQCYMPVKRIDHSVNNVKNERALYVYTFIYINNKDIYMKKTFNIYMYSFIKF